jgi:hypothetical protein
MDPTQYRYWPFDVLPKEQRTEQHRQEMWFLEMAYQAGYNPYMDGFENFGATGGERSGTILYRGSRGNHWEVVLETGRTKVLSAHLNDFGSAAQALLSWLRGVGGLEIVEDMRDHLVITRATAPGFVLHGECG